MTRALSLTRHLSQRAVHIHTIPRPSSISESREIYRLLSQFGEIDYFRNLRYDHIPSPGSALVIFKEDEAALLCYRKSPIRFRLGPAVEEEEVGGWQSSARKSPPREDGENDVPPVIPSFSPNLSSGESSRSNFGLGRSQSQIRSLSTRTSKSRITDVDTTVTDSLPTPPGRKQPMPLYEPITPTPSPPLRLFQIMVNPATTNFKDQIKLGAYYGHFGVDKRKIAHEDLHRKVPIGGLCMIDWRKAKRPNRVLEGEKQTDKSWFARMSLRERFEMGRDERSEGGKVDSG